MNILKIKKYLKEQTELLQKYGLDSCDSEDLPLFVRDYKIGDVEIFVSIRKKELNN